MTFILFALPVILVATTVRLVIHAVVLERVKISEHLRAIHGYGWESAVAPSPGVRERLNVVFREFTEGLGRWTMTRVPALGGLRRGDLSAAGYYDVTPEVVHGYRVIAGV